MPRVKRGVIANKRRRNVLKQTKGFRWGRKSKERAAKEALLHAGAHAFRGRKEKKRNFRTLWNVKIGAAVREQGMSYSRFIDALKKNKIELDRKVLADLAENEPEIFKKVVAAVAVVAK
jgi:large subunit ribosomal protein L20